jgi:hypothetical protein
MLCPRHKINTILCPGHNIRTMFCRGHNIRTMLCPGHNIRLMLCPGPVTGNRKKSVFGSVSVELTRNRKHEKKRFIKPKPKKPKKGLFSKINFLSVEKSFIYVFFCFSSLCSYTNIILVWYW